MNHDSPPPMSTSPAAAFNFSWFPPLQYENPVLQLIHTQGHKCISCPASFSVMHSWCLYPPTLSFYCSHQLHKICHVKFAEKDGGNGPEAKKNRGTKEGQQEVNCSITMTKSLNAGCLAKKEFYFTSNCRPKHVQEFEIKKLPVWLSDP